MGSTIVDQNLTVCSQNAAVHISVTTLWKINISTEFYLHSCKLLIQPLATLGFLRIFSSALHLYTTTSLTAHLKHNENTDLFMAKFVILSVHSAAKVACYQDYSSQGCFLQCGLLGYLPCPIYCSTQWTLWKLHMGLCE
jgi:hypothetical protein